MLARGDPARDSSPRFGGRNSHLTEISPLTSPRFWPPRFGEISARFWPPLFSCRRDIARNLGAFLGAEILIISISAAKNAPRFNSGEVSRPRSRRDENLGGQKRAEISEKFSQEFKP